MAELLIYQEIAALSKIDHLNVSIKRTDDFNFAKSVNSVPIVDAEFGKACVALPLVFAGDDQQAIPVALLGLSADQNFCVDDSGQWVARYTPAYLRRYPFVFSASDTDDQLTLCIDRAYAGINTDGVGERLFDSTGEATQYTQSVLNFLEEYQVSHRRTVAFCDRLIELELLEASQLQFTSPNGESGSMTGFMRVNEAKLRDLPDSELTRLIRDGHYDLIVAHLVSMNTLDQLLEKMPVTEQSASDTERSQD